MLILEKGKTLLVDGPARVHLRSGKVSVLGAQVKVGEQIVVRRGKCMPILGLVNCKVELILGESASHTINSENTIPSSWLQASEKILTHKEPTAVLVIGSVDCGKTGFCTFLANLAFEKKTKIAIIDGDMGQSDIGPPGTISLCMFNEPVIDLFKLRSEELRFIGVTSPSGKINAVLDAVGYLKQRAVEQSADFIIINTDGWVEGDAAAEYKVGLIESVAPDIIVAVQCEDELSPILNALKKFQVMVVQSPQIIKKRDQETRKLLRESAYKKYLKDVKVRSFPLSWVAVEGDLKFNGNNGSPLKKQIENIIGKEVLFCQEGPDRITIMLGKKLSMKEEDTKKLESELSKHVLWLRWGDEEGLLVALEDGNGKVLGLGTIGTIDFDKGTIALNTSVEESVSKILVGQIRLDAEGHEIGLVFENSGFS
jgi:polynucleotide 5'-hydroxyl-kinase GRC3/NOL9